MGWIRRVIRSVRGSQKKKSSGLAFGNTGRKAGWFRPTCEWLERRDLLSTWTLASGARQHRALARPRSPGIESTPLMPRQRGTGTGKIAGRMTWMRLRLGRRIRATPSFPCGGWSEN
jgi:hypothetical protein